MQAPMEAPYTSSLVTMIVAGVRIEKTDYRCYWEGRKGYLQNYIYSLIDHVHRDHALLSYLIYIH